MLYKYSQDSHQFTQFPDITTGSNNDNGTLVNTLTIPATPEYNGTEMVCRAFLDGPLSVSERTSVVTLTVIAGWYGVVYTNNRLLQSMYSYCLRVLAASTTVEIVEQQQQRCSLVRSLDSP